MRLPFTQLLYYMAMSSDQKQSTTTTSAGADRLPTLRPFTLPEENGSPRTKSLEARTQEMNALFKAASPLSNEELDDIVHSVQNVCPDDGNTIDFDKLRSTLKDVAHISHKDWTVTEANSEVLGDILLKDGIASPVARQILERILKEGNWDGAAEHAKSHVADADILPWAVLVTGVNGIRKTTSIYQPWWPELLQEALIPPAAAGSSDTKKRKSTEEFPLEQLPAGSNSFFRQLDHMIATLCNEDFKALYYLTQKELAEAKGVDTDDSSPPPALVKKYSDYKAAIFSRYRTLSELLGARLLKEAQKLKSNCMMETSGRDVAMFHYVDHFFPSQTYHKLALHFTINDLTQAQDSVDRRMVKEIQAGIQAVEGKNDFQVIYANAGGPYGSEVLPGVQEASDTVWNDVVLKGDQVGQDWYKATIAINAHPTEPWTAQAVRPDGTLGKSFTFSNQ